MSQPTATRPASRPSRRRATTRQPLRVVQGRRAVRRSWFPLVCVGLLVGGLISVLLLNTALAQGSYEVGRLQATSTRLADQEEVLTQAIDAQRAPEHLARRAADLGMVPANSAAFLRLSDGAVLGVATPATRSDGFTVVTPTTPPTNGAGSADGGAAKSTTNGAKQTKQDGTKQDASSGQSSGQSSRQGGSGHGAAGGDGQ